MNVWKRPRTRRPRPGARAAAARAAVREHERPRDRPGPAARRGRRCATGSPAAGCSTRRAALNADDHRRAIELREAIRELVAAHAGLPHDPDAMRDRQRRRRRAPGCAPCSTIRRRASSRRPTASTRALGRIVAAIHAAIGEGTWARLKACERDVCRWAFYDHSKNRSGHWCSMAVCGSREKNRRAYRRRVARPRASPGSG